MTHPQNGRTTAKRITVAMRRAKALEMKMAGHSIPEIMALGYRTAAAVYQDLDRALASYVGAAVEAMRTLENGRLDQSLIRLAEIEAKVREVRDRPHITVNNGRVITVPDPDDKSKEVPLLDDEPILHASKVLIGIEDMRNKIGARRAKLNGLDAPQTFHIMTSGQIEAAINELRAEMDALDADALADADPV